MPKKYTPKLTQAPKNMTVAEDGSLVSDSYYGKRPKAVVPYNIRKPKYSLNLD